MPVYLEKKLATTEGSKVYNIDVESYDLTDTEIKIIRKFRDIEFLFKKYVKNEKIRLSVFGSGQLTLRIENEKIDETKVVDDKSPLSNIGHHAIIEKYSHIYCD